MTASTQSSSDQACPSSTTGYRGKSKTSAHASIVRKTGQTAQQLVLADGELLEKILLQIDDMRTILLSQRVNGLFRHVIRYSSSLRQKLWLEPSTDLTSWRLGRLNPMLKQSIADKKHKEILTLSHSGCDVCLLTTMDASLSGICGSWKDMLVIQPHSQWLVFKTANCFATFESYQQQAFTEPPTAGQLVQASLVHKQRKANRPNGLPFRPEHDRRQCSPYAGSGLRQHRMKSIVQ